MKATTKTKIWLSTILLLAIATLSANSQNLRQTDDVDVLMNQVYREINEGGNDGMARLQALLDDNQQANWRHDQQVRALALLYFAPNDNKSQHKSKQLQQRLSASLNTTLGEEQTALQLSRMFEEGTLVPEQPKMAFSLLDKLSGKATFYREANYELACRLLDGYGCQPDVARAIQLLIKCAETGYKPALRELSLACKEQGLVINDNYLQFLMREGNHYDNLTRLKNGFIQVETNGKHGIIDRDGNTIVRPIYDQPVSFEAEGLTEVRLNGKYGFINERGETVLQPRYLAATEFNEDLAIVYDDEGWAIIDKAGNERLIDDFDAIRAFSGGKAIVTKNKKKGAIDRTGKVIVAPTYDDMGDFACDMAAVMKDSKWGYVDSSGKLIIPCRYDNAQPFVNPKKPFALVTYKGKEMCIDKRGKKRKP